MSGPCVAHGARGELVESSQAKVGGGTSGRTIHYLSSMARGQELRMGCPSSTVGEAAR